MSVSSLQKKALKMLNHQEQKEHIQFILLKNHYQLVHMKSTNNDEDCLEYGVNTIIVSSSVQSPS